MPGAARLAPKASPPSSIGSAAAEAQPLLVAAGNPNPNPDPNAYPNPNPHPHLTLTLTLTLILTLSLTLTRRAVGAARQPQRRLAAAPHAAAADPPDVITHRCDHTHLPMRAPQAKRDHTATTHPWCPVCRHESGATGDRARTALRPHPPRPELPLVSEGRLPFLQPHCNVTNNAYIRPRVRW